MHFAPELCLAEPLRAALGERYTTIDLERDDVDLKADITSLPFSDGAFQLILCNHVLEHVWDEPGALAELRRVLTAGGVAVITVPQDPGRERTYEDPAITDPGQRERHFGQHDHVRAYGDDIGDRLGAAGFAVEVVPVVQIAGDRVAARHGFGAGERIYVCR